MVAIILIAITSMFLFYLVNKKPKSTLHKEVYKTYTSKTLLTNYKTNAFEDVIDKVIIIEGKLKEIHFQNDLYTLYITHDNETYHIMCELEKNQNIKIKDLHVGQNVAIKGIVKGYLLDIILLHCIII